MSKDNKQSPSESLTIKTIFNNIAPHYGLMNKIMSLGLDKLWRQKVVDLVRVEPETNILDLACGTCDLTIMLAKKLKNEGQVIGLDYSAKMLEIGKAKIAKQNLSSVIKLIQGDARKLPFAAQEFDYVVIAFALRNISEREQVLREMKRVLKTDGTIITLDIFRSNLWGYRQLVMFYFKQVIPHLAKLIFNQYQEYNWLPRSIEEFITIEELALKLEEFDLKEIKVEKMMGGVVALHHAKK
ncbi:bifunctional demethylmenaquinone methyltransferase/2-methoxy-6-polyprenyl-1,4-benzoquinol methylase UbiE [Halanaerobacter jeridensis]|uniref:Demethylmenaquinone methyltransferase n=1 Tax=Halanaerobacter jeridensis TaxID=706427 RepID=A0A938XRR2_9FIRM|nr:bifunctional demethylmenaquinone methyltransferase/2-methoxy-6-polyprenyl-1,4-benzoquinol methylase UbiE [Halanaerobacter jeridensis]MBM7556218.1 demethylmenaquinone methyltransferase/2-methoxy-6-polyprenyl-1,4-benzoquinol methylase [Halanaerobacter jeridensis]